MIFLAILFGELLLLLVLISEEAEEGEEGHTALHGLRSWSEQAL